MSFNPHQWFLIVSNTYGGPANTFIGGVASVINTPALLASKILNYPSGTTFSASNIQNFTIVGDDIECYIGVDYKIKDSAFINTDVTASSPTYWRDEGLKCKPLGSSAFYVSRNTGLFYFPAVLTIGASNFYHANYGDADVADRIYYFPNCTNIGNPTVADTQMFGNTAITQKFYANTFLQTNNAGGVDATLTDGINNRGLIVVWILNQIAPNPITDLIVGNVFGTVIQLNFTAPTGSANAIDFYEVYLNGRYYQKITASGQHITGLAPNTTYNIEVKPVDIYYNKSASNIVTQTTASTYIIPTANLVSYYKMENNVSDSWGANHGTPTDITYASGLVGQTAVFNGSSSRILVADNSNLSFTDGVNDLPFSISFLVKHNALKANDFYIGKDGVGTKQEWDMNYEAGQFSIRLFSNGWANNISKKYSFTRVIGTTYHVLATYDGSKTADGIKLYINGISVGVNSIAGTYTGMVNDTNKMSIGNYEGGTTQILNGTLDELSIFNIELTAGEVLEINAKLNSGQSLI